MKKNVFTVSTILIATILASSALAQNPFRGVTSTVDGYTTWDSDMINIDAVEFTGKGVYVAVLDTGLTPNWREYFPETRIAAKLGIGFVEEIFVGPDGYLYSTGVVHTTTFIGSTGSTHGTHVTSTIIGYFYDSPYDTAPDIPPIVVRGIAPEVTIIPVKVLETYYLPGYTGPEGATFGTDRMVAAGIRYATALKLRGLSPMIITMSIGGPEPSNIIEDAINAAIEAGVIVVAAAGNGGTAGMDWPGAYPQVISVGACGWKYEWYGPDHTAPPPRYRLWWLRSDLAGYNDIPEPPETLDEVYITDWSSRELDGQDLDVVAPGSWVRGPMPGVPGYSHLPWWSRGIPGPTPGNFYYVGGTSMSTPHVTSIVALMLEKNPTLYQATVESIFESTALKIPPGSMMVYDYVSPEEGGIGWAWYTYEWESDATGAGLVQADAAIGAMP